MHRIGVSLSLLLVAILVAAIGATRASAFPGAISPEVPGVGELNAAAPEVEVAGGNSWLLRGSRTTWIEVRCATSSGAGCSGVLELSGVNAPARSTAFELSEAESEGVYVGVPRALRRMARRPAGAPLLARACVVDSSGRSACDAAGITIRARR